MDGQATATTLADTGHLTLSRRVDERLNLHLSTGETIVVTVQRIRQREVRLSIEAPKSVVVMRSEIDGNARRETAEVRR